jgi:hypothetical protein
MRSPTLLALIITGLIVVRPTFSNSAVAATIHAKSPHMERAGSVTRRRSANLNCPAHMVPTDMYYNGVRVCVDPHGYYEWSDGSTSPGPVSLPPFAVRRNAE